jgi:hypothetical protein
MDKYGIKRSGRVIDEAIAASVENDLRFEIRPIMTTCDRLVLVRATK